MKRLNSAKPWRVQSDEQGEFDEIVVGEWLHVERLDTNHYFVRIGERVMWVSPRPGGESVAVDHEELRVPSRLASASSRDRATARSPK